MANLIVRPATPGDLGTIVDFNARLALETEGLLIDRETLKQGVGALLTDGTRGCYNMASSEGRTVGQMMHTREWSDWRNGHIWWLQSVYVDPDHRQRGVFRALYEHLLKLATDDPDVVGLRLYVAEGNQSAQVTYERLGMTRADYLVMQHLVA